MLVFIGTYTSGTKSQGVYVLRFDTTTGRLSPVGAYGGAVNPSFLALAPNRRQLFAVSETDDGHVAAFALDPKTGALTLKNQQPSRGGAPCHVSLSADGRWALVANYSGGNFATLPVLDDGSLGAPACVAEEHPGARRESQRGHSIHLSPDNRYALACDLGLNRVFVYRFDPATGALAPHGEAGFAPGSGPRHLAFHPSGRAVFVIHESNSTLSALRYDAAKGTLTATATLSTLPADVTGGNSTAEVVAHPNGRFVWGSNRGHDSLACFAYDARTGGLTARGHTPTRGKTPRNFALAPGGQWLIAANMDSDSLAVFRVDGERGALTPHGDLYEVPRPVCVRYLSESV